LSISNSRIGIPWIITLYYGFPFYILLIKGSTPFIILIFWTRKSELNSGVIFTIILLFEEREIIEITSPLIPLVQKVVLSKLRVEIAKKEIACSI
jgi:hypothetical protein